MAKPLREFAELFFIKHEETGTVHIVVRMPLWHRDARWASDLSPWTTQCGRITAAGPGSTYQGTGRFRDEQLCRACYRTLTPADQERAFEHETPDDEDDEPEVAA